MGKFDYLEDDLRRCKLCEWRCGIDRLGDVNKHLSMPNTSLKNGVCGCAIPLVASSQLHPAPPASFDAFLTGCNFRCLFCQNWIISMFDLTVPTALRDIEGYYDPGHWAELALACLTSDQARFIKADRLFFTGGEPTCSLPWVEEVVRAARQIISDVKVNYDTNGYMTTPSLKRILEFATSITYDLKAFNPKLFSALTGAKVKPVLRNLEYIVKNAPEKLYELRVMVIPGVHDKDIPGMCKYLSELDPEIKLNFLAFRPNFVMENYFGAPRKFLDQLVKVAEDFGLKSVTWSGRPAIQSKLPTEIEKSITDLDEPRQLAIPKAFAKVGGCPREIRCCGICENKNDCGIKRYQASNFC
ncbi:radical SAM protein [[Eubacterium] cellulosolvens]